MHHLRRGLLLRKLWIGLLLKLRCWDVYFDHWRFCVISVLELCTRRVCDTSVNLMHGMSSRLLFGNCWRDSMCELRCWDLWHEWGLKCGLCVGLCSWEVFELGSECMLELRRGVFPSRDWSNLMFRGDLRRRGLWGYYGCNQLHLKLRELRRR